MKRLYLRIRTAGPPRKLQEACGLAAGIGDFGRNSPQVFVDDPKIRRRKWEPSDLQSRARLIDQLESGDEVIVADRATLAVSGEDWIATMGAIVAKGASLFIVETGEQFSWPIEIGAVLAEVVLAADQAKVALVHERMKKARGAQKESADRAGKASSGRKSVEIKKSVAFRRGLALWLDPNGPTGGEIAELTGISERTYIRRVGPITECRKKKRRVVLAPVVK